MADDDSTDLVPLRRAKHIPREIVFERPILTEDLATLNGLPPQSRRLIKYLAEHGELDRAMRQAGVPRSDPMEVLSRESRELVIKEVMAQGGITAEYLVEQLKMAIECEDPSIKIRAIKLACDLRGDIKRNNEFRPQEAERLFGHIDA